MRSAKEIVEFSQSVNSRDKVRIPENPGAASGALPNGLYVAPLWAVGAAGAVPVVLTLFIGPKKELASHIGAVL